MSFSSEENVEMGDLNRLKELIKDIDIAMLTTVGQNGLLRSRPMATQEMEADGTLFFFLDTASPKAHEVEAENQVNVVYAQPKHNRYISVSGKAAINKDMTKIKELWNPILLAWFPEGLKDPNLGLLQVTIDQAEYWDSAGKVTEIIGLAKALTTGHTYQGSTHGRINM
jgi:general stress protein 26